MNELEYIIETKPEKDWQKQLNQWRHDYEINVISMTSTKITNLNLYSYDITICLTRKRK